MNLRFKVRIPRPRYHFGRGSPVERQDPEQHSSLEHNAVLTRRSWSDVFTLHFRLRTLILKRDGWFRSDDDGHAFCPAYVLVDSTRWRQCQKTRARRDRIYGWTALIKLQEKFDHHGRAYCDEKDYKILLATAFDDLVCLGRSHDEQQDWVVARWDKMITKAVEQAGADERKAICDAAGHGENKKAQDVDDMLQRLSKLQLMQDELRQSQSKTDERYKSLAAQTEALRSWKDSPLASKTGDKNSQSRQDEKPVDHSTVKVKVEVDQEPAKADQKPHNTRISLFGKAAKFTFEQNGPGEYPNPFANNAGM